MLPPAKRTLNYSVCCLVFLVLAGCSAVGFVAHALPPPKIDAQYSGLAGQKIAVMVWVDRGVRVDYPKFSLDLANSIQNKLMEQTGKKGALEGATFPWAPASVVRYQEEHPESEFDPIEKTATRLGVTRVIYVEVEDFTSRTEATQEMFRGAATASLKTLEVAGDQSHVAYEESNVQVSFPPKVGPEGTHRGNDYLMYRGTVEVLAQRIVDRFVPHEDEES